MVSDVSGHGYGTKAVEKEGGEGWKSNSKKLE
jgi:hypothetical protein